MLTDSMSLLKCRNRARISTVNTIIQQFIRDKSQHNKANKIKPSRLEEIKHNYTFVHI